MGAKAWTDEETALFKRLHAEGYTFSGISTEIPGRSRSACIGHAYRLGLVKKPEWSTQARARAAHRPVKRTSVPSVPQTVPMGPPQPPVAPLAPRETVSVPHERESRELISLFDLKERTCRWPIGTPGTVGFGFCGDETEDVLRPYCACHNRLAYNGTASSGRKWVEPKRSGVAMRAAVGRY